MKKLSVASIRRAVRHIEDSGNAVTLIALARELKASSTTVKKYLNGIKDLKDEIHLETDAKQKKRRDDYLLAARRLQAGGIIITYARLAYLCRSTKPAVLAGLTRTDPRLLEGITIMNEAAFRQRQAITRAGWILRNEKSRRITVTTLARWLGYERTSFSRLLGTSADLRACLRQNQQN